MKKALLASIMVISLFLMTGCPLRVIEASVTKLPDKLIYIAGQDTELDLTGGKLTLVLSNGFVMVDEMSAYSHRIEHEIDFNIPGTYVVEFLYYDCSFEITVVAPD